MSSPHTSSAVVFSKWLQAALFLHHYFGAVCARTACSEFQNAASLCEPTTRAERLAWSCILAGYGATVIVFVHVIAAMFMSSVGESRGGESAEGEMCWASP